MDAFDVAVTLTRTRLSILLEEYRQIVADLNQFRMDAAQSTYPPDVVDGALGIAHMRAWTDLRTIDAEIARLLAVEDDSWPGVDDINAPMFHVTPRQAEYEVLQFDAEPWRL